MEHRSALIIRDDHRQTEGRGLTDHLTDPVNVLLRGHEEVDGRNVWDGISVRVKQPEQTQTQNHTLRPSRTH